MTNRETITALASAPGVSGLAVIRISGSSAVNIIDKCFSGKKEIRDCASHTIHYGAFNTSDGFSDMVTVSLFKSPNSYTGEDVIEIGCHGGSIVYNKLIEEIINQGARLAEPGEFTRRAFLNAKLDLTQAEAVADLIHSVSTAGAQTSARQLAGSFTKRLKDLWEKILDIAALLELELDFSEEDIEFVDKKELHAKISETEAYCLELADSFRSAEILRSGYFVSIVGYPNSGKSTLFNTLLKKERAIVSHLPGTTRDYLEETIHINGLPVRIVDTAGIRETEDLIEIAGIKLAEHVLAESNMIIVLNDISQNEDYSNPLFDSLQDKYKDCLCVLVENKIDTLDKEIDKAGDKIYISAKSNDSVEQLKNFIYSKAQESMSRINDVLVNQRQAILLKKGASLMHSALLALDSGAENEIISIDIREAGKVIGEITGEVWNEETLNNIFSRFCIGK